MDPLPQEVLAELIVNAFGDFKTAGLVIWHILAVVMVVWKGVKMGVAGRFDAWEATRLAVLLGVTRAMFAFY